MIPKRKKAIAYRIFDRNVGLEFNIDGLVESELDGKAKSSKFKARKS